MTRGAWYRSPDWSDSDRETFYDRLERSRSEAARRRYVSEKAFALAEAGGTNQLVGAVELFGLLLTRWPDPLAGATCWSSISECRLRLGAIRMARSRPSGSASARSGPSPEYARSRGPTSFTSSSATSAATFTKRRWFAQEQLASEPAFPRQRFLLHAARAVFLEAAGRIEESRSNAAEALVEAGRPPSGFARPPALGLVAGMDALVARMQSLAGDHPIEVSLPEPPDPDDPGESAREARLLHALAGVGLPVESRNESLLK